MQTQPIPDALPAGKHRISKRMVLRAGYAGMLALLFASALEAYRIQQRTQRESHEIYRRYVEQQDHLYRLRRILYLGGIYARDLFLSQQPERTEAYRRQMTELQVEARDIAAGLSRLPVSPENAADLRKNTEEYVQLLASISDWDEEKRRQSGYAFIQRELVPRRNTAGEMARNWLALSSRALADSEREFAATNRAATNRLLMILSVSILVGLVVIRFSLKHAENLEREGAAQFDATIRAKAELQQLSARLLEIQEDERKRLSRELHDEIGQTLTALRIEISHAQALLRDGPTGPQERLERARELAERTVRTVRDISLLLRPSLLDDLGLGPALQGLAEDFSRRTGIACDVTETQLQDDLPETVKTCVYRVVQEALNNIQKHAAARRVAIDVKAGQAALVVSVADDGRGCDLSGRAADRSGRLGILGMRERATALGGTLAFNSSPGAGTRLVLTIPVTPAAQTQLCFDEVHV
jgi:signal transduction histidine kinase